MHRAADCQSILVKLSTKILLRCIYLYTNSIHSDTTPILHKTPEVEIKTYTKLKMKNGAFSDLVIFYLTSQENSPGIFDLTWKDGKPVRIIMDKNTFLQYSLQPLMTKYLEEMGKCQKEPYYQCIASQLDTIEYGFSHCSNKCIPDAFSIVSKN